MEEQVEASAGLTLLVGLQGPGTVTCLATRATQRVLLHQGFTASKQRGLS